MKRKIIYVDNFLTSHGHTPTTGTTLVKQFREEGYTVIPTSSKQNKAVRLADMVSTLYANRKNSVALIATYSSSAFFFACTCGLFCHIFNIPYIPCLHGGNLPTRIKNSPGLSASLFGKSFNNVAVSGYLKKSLDENEWKSTVIGNNIEIDSYPFHHRKAVQPTLLWVRSFHKIYNPTLAIRVIHKLKTDHPSIHLTMIGPDKDGSLEECKKLVNNLKLEANISFTGLLSQKQWIELSASKDIFINTTNFDNLPVSVVEAMALGLIVISTRVGGVPYLVTEHQNGILVEAGSEEQFIHAIKSVLINPGIASALSQNARKTAEQYDWKNIKQQWKQLFQTLPA